MRFFRDGLDCPKSSVSVVQGRFAVDYLNFGLVRKAIEKASNDCQGVTQGRLLLEKDVGRARPALAFIIVEPLMLY